MTLSLPSFNLFCVRDSIQGGPSLNSDSGLFNSNFSNSCGVSLFTDKKIAKL